MLSAYFTSKSWIVIIQECEKLENVENVSKSIAKSLDTLGMIKSSILVFLTVSCKSVLSPEVEKIPRMDSVTSFVIQLWS